MFAMKLCLSLPNQPKRSGNNSRFRSNINSNDSHRLLSRIPILDHFPVKCIYAAFVLRIYMCIERLVTPSIPFKEDVPTLPFNANGSIQNVLLLLCKYFAKKRYTYI